ncbi:hypothetical protein HK099_000908 [Clydaea vesicula]|uniref:VWFA domain-containing protein n=1 Tax=Clydaea vesicula TaxID=447962 RepID=A0AAD5XZW1_9FUNG|nr:hypothetical protein HK099_000908 [Clydaea vesicula]KAJ3384668.1 hypothetical protein HDU92_003474 [Lobulomyces angularis]
MSAELSEIQKQIAALNLSWQAGRREAVDSLENENSVVHEVEPSNPSTSVQRASSLDAYQQNQQPFHDLGRVNSQPSPKNYSFGQLPAGAEFQPCQSPETFPSTNGNMEAPSYYSPIPPQMANANKSPSITSSNSSVYSTSVPSSAQMPTPSSSSSMNNMSIMPSRTILADQMKARLDALKKNKINKPVGSTKSIIDIALLFDLTGSMQHWFDQAHRKVQEIVNEVHQKYPESELRMAFVGYRDFEDDGLSRYEVHDFSAADELSNFMATKVGLCAGGFDAAEDVIGGFVEILKLSWKAKTRLVVFITDAPGHGAELHDMGPRHDRYIDCEDPNGLRTSDFKNIIRELCNKNIDLHFFHLTEATKKMEVVFDTLLKKYSCKLFVWKLDQNVDQFLPNVLQSIDSSVMKSNWG